MTSQSKFVVKRLKNANSCGPKNARFVISRFLRPAVNHPHIENIAYVSFRWIALGACVALRIMETGPNCNLWNTANYEIILISISFQFWK